MNDKSEAMKKIQFQTLKGKNIPQEKKMEMVTGLLKANVAADNNTIISSEMPKEILGIAVDWEKLDVKKEEPESPVEKPTKQKKTRKSKK